MKWQDVVNIDPEIQGGEPVLRGTRVPIESLFWHLEDGISIEEFVDHFPTVKKEQCLALLELSSGVLKSPKTMQLYESVT